MSYNYHTYPFRGGSGYDKKTERGLINQNNSCYCDVTIFSMFARTEIFDHLFLNNIREKSDGESNKTVDTSEMYSTLEHIVTPLRKKECCHPFLVQNFRDSLCVVNPRMQFEMLDVEEFITTFFSRALNLPRFIRYSVGTGAFLHQLFLFNTGGAGRELMDIQSTFKQSMKNQGLLLADVPFPALFVKIPRGRDEVNRSTTVIPNIILDVSSSMVDNGKGHTSTKLVLLAVICLRSYHYTTFVRERKNTWCYFDSLSGVQNINDIEIELTRLEKDFNFVKKISYHTQIMITTIHMCIYKPFEEESEKEEIPNPNLQSPSSSQGKKNKNKRVKKNHRPQFENKRQIAQCEETSPKKPKNLQAQDDSNAEGSMQIQSSISTVVENMRASESDEGGNKKTLEEAQNPTKSSEPFTLYSVQERVSENDPLLQTVDEEKGVVAENIVSKDNNEKCSPSTFFTAGPGFGFFCHGALERRKFTRESLLDGEDSAEFSCDESLIDPADESSPTIRSTEV